MQYQAFVRTAAAVLVAAASGWAAAQAGGSDASAPVPSPQTMTDVAPLPAQERSSLGAIVMMESPVLAQRQQFFAGERIPDTRSMGAGPARVLQREKTRAELEAERAGQAAGTQSHGGRLWTPK